MAEPSPTAERREQLLGEFAEWLHATARETHRRAMAAEDAQEFAIYSNGLAKLGRGLRQTLALQARFEAERLKDQAAGAAEAARNSDAPRQWKCNRVRHAMERLVWDEHERDEDYEDGPGERLLEDIETRLQVLSCEDDFLDTSDEVLIAGLCKAFGLEAPPHIVTALAIVAAADAPRPALDGGSDTS